MHLNLIKIKKYIIIFSAFCFLLSAVFVFGQVALAATDYGLDETAAEGYLGDKDRIKDVEAKFGKSLPTIIGEIVGAVLAFVGLLFLILLIYGGFIWMTAGGNEEKLKKSVSLITQSIIGLIIIAGAYLIAQFVGDVVLLPFTK